MAEPIFIGIDGGGTHCRARIRDPSGRLVGEGAGGSANIRLDLDLVWSSILTACRQALRRGGLEARELARAHVGLGLAGSAQPSAVARMLAYQHPFRAVAVETDAHIAWLGAFGGGEGAILIVGTGSCGYGCLQGRRFTIGGRGFQISDEEAARPSGGRSCAARSGPMMAAPRRPRSRAPSSTASAAPRKRWSIGRTRPARARMRASPL